MDGVRETQEAGEYLKRHIESSQPEKPVNPILKNPDSGYLRDFMKTGRVTTPYFTFSGTLSGIKTDEFIDRVVEGQRKQLDSEGGFDIRAEGRLMGIRIGLGMRLESVGGYPAQVVRTLEVAGDGVALDIRSLLPEQYQVVWVPSGSIEKSALDLGNKLLIINGDLTSPEGLLVVLHEIGHYVDLGADPDRRSALPEIQANMMAPKQEELKSLDSEFAKAIMGEFSPVTEDDVRIFLEAERNAWAFALRTISRLTNDRDLIQACREYIHEQPLRMQADILRSGEFVK